MLSFESIKCAFPSDSTHFTYLIRYIYIYILCDSSRLNYPLWRRCNLTIVNLRFRSFSGFVSAYFVLDIYIRTWIALIVRSLITMKLFSDLLSERVQQRFSHASICFHNDGTGGSLSRNKYIHTHTHIRSKRVSHCARDHTFHLLGLRLFTFCVYVLLPITLTHHSLVTYTYACTCTFHRTFTIHALRVHFTFTSVYEKNLRHRITFVFNFNPFYPGSICT